jgi:predicted O-methyltransferase YrrM
MTYGTATADEMFSQSVPGEWGHPRFCNDELASGVLPGEGQLLYGLVRALRPSLVLEIGTGHGFSAIHLAAGCRDNEAGRVVTVEISEERRGWARQNIHAAGLDDWAEVRDQWPPDSGVGLVFLDAGHEAEDVRAYLRKLRPMLARHAPVLVHDFEYKNHVVEAAGHDWRYVLMPSTGFAGMAILQAVGE